MKNLYITPAALFEMMASADLITLSVQDGGDADDAGAPSASYDEFFGA